MSENRTRFRLDQRRAPIYEALEQFRQMRVVPFDVPGHKRGRGNPELTAFLGQQCVGVDVNSMKPLDNLCHPVSVIREAEELAADAFGAAHAFLMVGGTTSSVQSMVLTACKRGDEIILPRNVHRSVLNALVLCGAVPGLCQPRGGQASGHLAGHEAGAGGKGHQRAPQRRGCAGEQPHLLRHLLRPAGHRQDGTRRRDALPGRRGPRHPLLLWRRAARFRHGSRCRYGFRLHAQERRQPDRSPACCSSGPMSTRAMCGRSST